jgi:Glutathione S-transferase, N-terminal domain
VKLYVCYGTYGDANHPCGKAHKALKAAGHEPEVIKTYGCFGSDRFWNRRQAIKEMTGNYKVPTLVLDDGTIVDESQNIVDWAAAHRA